MATLQINIEQPLLDKAQSVVEDLGIDLSSAIHLFLTKMVQQNNLPFKEEDPFYGPENQAHLRAILDDYRHKKNFAPHELIED